MERYKIVETDNFDGDYPDESELKLPPMTKSQAMALTNTINTIFSSDVAPRYWKVEPMDYKLQPGFEP